MTTTTVDRPGIYDNMHEPTYHADPTTPTLGPSLSVTGAKKLLPPSTPARFKWERDNPQPPRDVFDFGHAAHALILGVGLDLVTVEADDWRGKAAREERDNARAEGKVPLLVADMLRAKAMAHAVLTHPVAKAILSDGTPERSLFWQDETTGVTRRARLDWLRDNAAVDLKTAADASPTGFAKAVATYSYHQQDDWYTEGVATLTGEVLPFLFLVVEKEPPHLVGVYQLDEEARAIGRDRNRRALDVYAECAATNTWPGYSTDIELLTLPRWATH